MFWKIRQEISLSDLNMTDFFEISLKIERTPLYYQNFPDPLLITVLLSFACSRHINKCKYLIFVKFKNISQWKRFQTIFAENWKGCNFTVNGHRNFKLSGKVTSLWYFSEIGKNQYNEIASSTACNLKNSSLL